MAEVKERGNTKVKEEQVTQTKAGKVHEVGVVILRWEKGEPEFWTGRRSERIQVI